MSRRIEVLDTPLGSLKVLVRLPIEDNRGYFEPMICSAELHPLFPPNRRIEQVNRSLTVTRGTVRGMHFQRPPYAEVKVVGCLRGEVFDVAVDLRRGSPTFLRVHGTTLSAENHRSLLIPEGFAHGFQTLTPDVELLYFHTAVYRPDYEGGLNALDPRLGSPWPEPISERSARDLTFPFLTDGFTGMMP
jgi:dTDP-4-dehydrorhamnose 3,5-epimerase